MSIPPLEELRQRFKNFRVFHKFSLRKAESLIGISNAFLSQFQNGKNISYENAVKLDTWMRTTGEPKLCAQCFGRGYVK